MVVVPESWPLGTMTGLLSAVIVGPAPPELTGGVSRTVPAPFSRARCWAARHWSSRLVATGEFRARAPRARSQIGWGGAPVVGRLTLPILGGLGVSLGGPQISPTESSNAPDRPLTPTATRPAGQYWVSLTCVKSFSHIKSLPLCFSTGPSNTAFGSALRF